MLQAMNTGHDGSLTTIHANSPRDALSRVETLVLTGGVELPLKAIREQIASAFDMVVQVSRLVDGTRRITHITEVLRMESDVVTLQDLFLAKPVEDGEEAAAGSNNRLLGPMRATGIKPQFLSKMGENGVHLPPQFFQLEPERGDQPRGAPDGLRQGTGMRRALVLVAGLAAVLAIAVGASTAAPPRVQIAQVDTSRYPLITATVIAPGSDKLEPGVARPPPRTASPSRRPSRAAARAAAIGVALDVSRSTEGAPARRRASRPPRLREGQAPAAIRWRSTRSATRRIPCTPSTPTSTRSRAP